MRPLKIILSVKPRRGNTLTEVFTRDIEGNPFEKGFGERTFPQKGFSPIITYKAAI